VIVAIQISYIIAAILWIYLILIFGLSYTNTLGYFILSIPLWIFLLGFINICLVDKISEKEALSLSYLTVGLIVLFPIIAWFKDSDNSTRRDEAIGLLIVSVTLILVSSLEFCVNGKWMSLVRHIKSMIQTIAITLIIFALHLYFHS